MQIILCRYTLKERSLFIVFLETTSRLITFSQRSIKLLMGILFEFVTPAKITESQRRISLFHITLKLATLPEYSSLFVVKSSSLIKKLGKFNGTETTVMNGRVFYNLGQNYLRKFSHQVHFSTQQNYFQNDAFAERKPLPPIQCCFPQTPRDQAFF